jgi:hypothetical protein
MTPDFPDSLCHRCAARRLIQGRSSTFIMCTALPEKYPRQPVRFCPAFVPEEPDAEAPRANAGTPGQRPKV